MLSLPISDDVRGILEQCSMTADRVYLPQIQLERTLYVAVDKILHAAGGKWNRSLQCHVFLRDPRPILLPGLATGTMSNVQQQLQAFYTPPAVAQRMIAVADINPDDDILEPSAGMGALAYAASTIVPKQQIWCVDTDDVACAALAKAGFIHVFQCDFLTCHGFATQGSPHEVHDGLFDIVLMNPPFINGQDMAHIQHAHTFLKPSGVLVSIIPSMTGRKTRTKMEKAFHTFLATHLEERIDIPGGSFADSGTQVSTSLIVLRAPRYRT